MVSHLIFFDGLYVGLQRYFGFIALYEGLITLKINKGSKYGTKSIS